MQSGKCKECSKASLVLRNVRKSILLISEMHKKSNCKDLMKSLMNEVKSSEKHREKIGSGSFVKEVP